jgi:phage gp29-like protein
MATLYDAHGRKVNRGVLPQEVADASVTSIRQVWFESVANNLTPQRLGSIMAQADQNDLLNYLTLAEEMEERDAHYHSVLSTRRQAIQGLPISVSAASDDAKDVKIADAVREEVVETDIFTAMLPDATDALGKGFAAVEIMWDRQGRTWWPCEYKRRDQRNFQYSTEDGVTLGIIDGSPNGKPLDPFKFIYHLPKIKSGLPTRGGLARLAAVAYMCKGYTIKHWMAFMEIYGIPFRVGRYDSGEDEKSKASLKNAVASLGTDAAAILPKDMDIELIETSKTTGADALFSGAADWFDRQVSKGVLGQTMTTDDGSSLSQAQVHDQVRGDILKSDAWQIGATLRRDLVKSYVDLNFGAQKKYPLLRFIAEEPEDLVKLSKSLSVFINHGLRVEASVIRDKFNLAEPEEDAEVLLPEALAALGDAGGPSGPGGAGGGDGTDGADGDEEESDNPDDDQQGREEHKSQTAASQKDRDGVDDIVDSHLDNWTRVMDPYLNVLTKAAADAESYEHFIAIVSSELSGVDADALVKDLATAALKARGLGDVSDG